MDNQHHTKTVDLGNGETYYYTESGDPSHKPFLLIHGTSGYHAHWNALVPVLAKCYRVFALDLRGCGNSTYNTPITVLDDFADDIALFCGKLGLKKVIIMGWSLGGGVTMKFASRHPDLAEKIILHCSIGIVGFPFYFLDDKGAPDLTKRIKTVEEIKSHPMFQTIPLAQSTKNIELIGNFFKATCFNGPKPTTKELLDGWAEAALLTRNWYDCLNALNHYNMSDHDNGVSAGTNEIKKVKCPVLILAGGKDLLCTLDKQEETIAALGDLATFKVWDDSGHAVIWDHFDEAFQMVKDFVK